METAKRCANGIQFQHRGKLTRGFFHQTDMKRNRRGKLILLFKIKRERNLQL